MSRSILKSILQAVFIAGLASGCSAPPVEIADNREIASQEKASDPDSFSSLLNQRVKTGTAIGLAVSIVDNDQQEFINVGLANSTLDQKITSDSIFEIGSISKTFTALVLADMVVKGEVDLDDPASKYLPSSVTMPRFEGKEITLRDLATHTSALPRMPSNFNPADPLNPYADYTPELMYAFLSNHDLDRAIGEKVDYSNLGMGLLGHILELHSGQSYEALVAERVLTPLGMSNTFLEVPKDKQSIFTTGHDVAGEPTSHWDLATLSGAGGLRSDITDMTIYLKANMGLIDTPMTAAIEMTHELQKKEADNTGYIGLGWFTGEDAITWHNGGTGGYRSFMGFDKANQRGVVVLTNSQDNSDLIGHAILKNAPEMLKPKTENLDLNFTSEELERFVGEYQLAPNFIISITRKDSNLFLQATGQSKFPIFAKSQTEFFLKVVDASVIFKMNEDGEVTSLTLDQNGMMQPAIKLK